MAAFFLFPMTADLLLRTAFANGKLFYRLIQLFSRYYITEDIDYLEEKKTAVLALMTICSPDKDSFYLAEGSCHITNHSLA
jgi:hypothetical protein